MSDNNLQSLAANTELFEGSKDYIDIINQALSDNNNKNIAITGTYGSGKSTIINAVFNKQEIEGEAVRISKLTFIEGKQSEDGEGSIENMLEQHILQQLYFKVDPNKMPYSRFVSIFDLDPKKIASSIFYHLLMIVITYVLLRFSIFEHFILYFSQIITDTSVNSLLIFPIIILAIPIAVLYTYWIMKLIQLFKKFSITKFGFSHSGLNFETDLNESAFNKYLTEIIYMFAKTDIKYVIFEDLDRYKNIMIFEKLRELNVLLNSSYKLKKRHEKIPIIFVYALDDSLFTRNNLAEDVYNRTKYFDLFIPIIKISHSSNAEDFFRKYLKESIDNDLISTVSLYINDLRMIKNISNEFITYYRMLKESENKDHLFSLVVYKNMYPDDFANLVMNKGIVYEIFKRRELVVDKWKITNEQNSNDLKITSQMMYYPISKLLKENKLTYVHLNLDNNIHQLLWYLLSNNWINERYEELLTYKVPGSMLQDDIDFLKHLKSNDISSIRSYSNLHPERIIDKITLDDVDSNVIFNLKLMLFLLERNDTYFEMLETILIKLHTRGKYVFFTELLYFLSMNKNELNMRQLLINKYIKVNGSVYDLFWKEHGESDDLILDEKDRNLHKNQLWLSFLKVLIESGIVVSHDKKWFLMSDDFVKKANSLLSLDKYKLVVAYYKSNNILIDLTSLDNMEVVLLDEIIDQSIYYIDYKNIKIITDYLKRKSPRRNELTEHVNYHLICQLDYKLLSNYLISNIDKFIKLVLLQQNKYVEESESFIALLNIISLNNLNLETQLNFLLIEKAVVNIDVIADIVDIKIREEVVNKEKFNYTCQNYICIIKDFSQKQTLIKQFFELNNWATFKESYRLFIKKSSIKTDNFDFLMKSLLEQPDFDNIKLLELKQIRLFGADILLSELMKIDSIEFLINTDLLYWNISNYYHLKNKGFSNLANKYVVNQIDHVTRDDLKNLINNHNLDWNETISDFIKSQHSDIYTKYLTNCKVESLIFKTRRTELMNNYLTLEVSPYSKWTVLRQNYPKMSNVILHSSNKRLIEQIVKTLLFDTKWHTKVLKAIETDLEDPNINNKWKSLLLKCLEDTNLVTQLQS